MAKSNSGTNSSFMGSFKQVMSRSNPGQTDSQQSNSRRLPTFLDSKNLTSKLVSSKSPSNINVPSQDLMFSNIPFEEVAKACNGFSSSHKIGEGTFGEVYKGKRNNQDIAVKKTSRDKLSAPNIELSEIFFDTYLTELKVLHGYPARNILPLLAISFSEDMSFDPCLIYEHMPNGSLDDRLLMKNGTPPLTWSQRAIIAKGTARGLSHLHANNIIHQDIKSANILLDRHFEPKIGDLGLARGGSNDPSVSYRTITRIQGTSWYLPDDYMRSFQLHPSIDTFCYGITLFELVTGEKYFVKFFC